MLYKNFKNVVQMYGNKPAINDITYSQLLNMIDNQEYTSISNYSDYRVLIDVMVAAKHKKPIIVPPKDKTDYSNPLEMPSGFNVILYTSGSTSGIRKPIIINEKMIVTNAFNSALAHSFTSDDIIYNVFSMNHTGGMNGQVIPGLLVGCSIIIEEFNAFNFFRRLNDTNTTVTHLTPRMLKLLRKVESTKLRFITAGSDCIKREYIEDWIKNGVPFMINYGMSEAGPITINHTFTSIDELNVFDNGIPLGNTKWCEYKIENNELLLKGAIVTTEDEWLCTGDCVTQIDEWIYYNGRKSAGCNIVKKRY